MIVGIADEAAPMLETAAEWLEGRAGDPAPALLFGHGPHGLVFALAEPAAELAAELAERFDVRIGLSTPVAYTSFVQGHDEARSALRRGAAAVSRFGDVASSGILGALDTDLARLVAASALAPLVEHDRVHGTDLVTTARVWLENDARLDATATALGVHRHTVRARIALVERIQAADLSAFPARAQLWAALQVANLD